jgi:hypothetical protein
VSTLILLPAFCALSFSFDFNFMQTSAHSLKPFFRIKIFSRFVNPALNLRLPEPPIQPGTKSVKGSRLISARSSLLAALDEWLFAIEKAAKSARKIFVFEMARVKTTTTSLLLHSTFKAAFQIHTNRKLTLDYVTTALDGEGTFVHMTIAH